MLSTIKDDSTKKNAELMPLLCLSEASPIKVAAMWSGDVSLCFINNFVQSAFVLAVFSPVIGRAPLSGTGCRTHTPFTTVEVSKWFDEEIFRIWNIISIVLALISISRNDQMLRISFSFSFRDSAQRTEISSPWSINSNWWKDLVGWRIEGKNQFDFIDMHV